MKLAHREDLAGKVQMIYVDPHHRQSVAREPQDTGIARR